MMQECEVAKAKVIKATAKAAESKRAFVSQSSFPQITLEPALRIAQALWDNFAGKDAPPHQIAIAMELSPTSGTWRNLCGSSIAYGLTDGGYNAAAISLTPLGRRIVAPTAEGDDLTARVEAILTPTILREFYSKYDKAKFPKDEIVKNVIVEMGLPKERSQKALEIIKENGLFGLLLQQTKTGLFVAVNSPAANQQLKAKHEIELPTEPEESVSDGLSDPLPRDQGVKNTERKNIFVAHGKNHKPLEDLKKILNQFKIPFKVAIDEPNKGRPISAKVASLMRECSAGIFIFTKDEAFQKKSQNDVIDVWRPSENVVYELGAATILWSQKIIIMREDGVNFPSDFSDLGYITFKDGELSSKALEILKELVALELVKVSAA